MIPILSEIALTYRETRNGVIAMRLQFCANRRPVIREAITALLLISGILICSAPAQTPPAHANIVVILADDLGYGDVSFNGCPDLTTPNIDSLTKNGVRCSNGYVTHPFCSPSR